MAKKNKQGKRKRTFKVGASYCGIPFIRFGGKYLSRELGLNGGDRLELIHDGDCIILRKFSAKELAQYKQEKEQKALLKKLFPRNQKQATALMIAENRTNTYSVESEINHAQILEKHRKILDGTLRSERS